MEQDILASFVERLEEQDIRDEVKGVITDSLETTTISQQTEAESLAHEIIARSSDEAD